MKTIGLIGGMSWESTAVYYQLLNELARERLGGIHSAELLLFSFDFAEIEALQSAADWETATERMIEAARNLQSGGAECLVICTNTMHRMADEVQAAISVPLIHIADATAEAIKTSTSSTPLLLGTRYTMEQDFYRGRLERQHGITVHIPDETQRKVVHDVIYDELCLGEVRSASKARYLEIIADAQTRGADGVVLGCTEVGLLIGADDVDVPVFDTAELHAQAALAYALS